MSYTQEGENDPRRVFRDIFEVVPHIGSAAATVAVTVARRRQGGCGGGGGGGVAGSGGGVGGRDRKYGGGGRAQMVVIFPGRAAENPHESTAAAGRAAVPFDP